MPSSPTEPTTLLTGLASTWDHAYEALVRGDLPRVASLMASADQLVAQLPAGLTDDPRLRDLHGIATFAHGRLQTAMREGLDVVQRELVRVRQGQRTLVGYTDPNHGIGERVQARA